MRNSVKFTMYGITLYYSINSSSRSSAATCTWISFLFWKKNFPWKFTKTKSDAFSQGTLVRFI